MYIFSCFLMLFDMTRLTDKNSTQSAESAACPQADWHTFLTYQIYRLGNLAHCGQCVCICICNYADLCLDDFMFAPVYFICIASIQNRSHLRTSQPSSWSPIKYGTNQSYYTGLGPILRLRTHLILRGIDSPRNWKHSLEMLLHTDVVVSHNRIRFSFTAHPWHKSPVPLHSRLRYGDSEDHVSTVISLSS